MPRRCPTDARLPALLREQDWVIHRDQAFDLGLSRHAIGHRVSTGQWQRILPLVCLAAPGEPTRRQLLIASLLYAGPEAAIDGVDACRFHGVRAVPIDDTLVHVV